MTVLTAITIVMSVTVIALVAGAVSYHQNQIKNIDDEIKEVEPPSTWEMLSSRRRNRHIAVMNIDGGDPAARLEMFETEGISPRRWCRVVIGEQGEGFLADDLEKALELCHQDLDAQPLGRDRDE